MILMCIFNNSDNVNSRAKRLYIYNFKCYVTSYTT